MTYTFDDAIEELERLQGSAGYATQGEPEALRFSGGCLGDDRRRRT